MSKEFNLRYEQWDEPMKLGTWHSKGTIRTVPENYYVADVNADNTLEFGNLEAETKDINQSKVEAWWKNKENKGEAR